MVAGKAAEKETDRAAGVAEAEVGEAEVVDPVLRRPTTAVGADRGCTVPRNAERNERHNL